MSTHHPQQPEFPQQPGHPHQPGYSQPGYPQPGYPQPGFPQQPGYWQPPVAPKKRSKALGCFGVLAAVIVMGGIAAVAGAAWDESPSGSTSASAATTPSASSHSSKAAASQQSTLDAFKAYAKEHESAKTREAASHVTKIQGADKNNDILDTADIYTDYTGDLASADTGNAKLLASAFADFQSSRGKDSKNGLVTVYNADGDMLGNGNY